MIRGLYSATTGLEASALTQDLVAQNLANSSVPGYRRRGVAFETFERAAGVRPEIGDGALLGSRPFSIYNSFEPGPLEQTGNPLDAAVQGDGFFVVDGPNGPLFTRNGSFVLNGQNQLQTRSGLFVRGQGGRIAVPPGTREITIDQDGRILADNLLVDRLQLARFPNPNVLRRAGPSLFEGPAPGAQPEIGEVRVEQGFLEGSNAQAVTEMVFMIQGLRHYEASQRALRAIAEAVELNTRPER